MPSQNNVTPLREVEPGLLVKFDIDNPGASHKVRAARYIVRRGVEQGLILPGTTTVIEKTGGNFGLGLVLACAEIGVPVELAVGLSFSPIKRACLERLGATLIGVDRLHAGQTPREIADQLDARSDDTRSLHFVACAGTGADLTGITRALRRRNFDVTVTLVEPEGCDSRNGFFIHHRLEGMAVGVKPPMLDWDLVDEVRRVDQATMLNEQQRFAKRHGWMVGNTSAACLAIAAEIAARPTVDRKVLSIAYDHGLWYPPTT